MTNLLLHPWVKSYRPIKKWQTSLDLKSNGMEYHVYRKQIDLWYVYLRVWNIQDWGRWIEKRRCKLTELLDTWELWPQSSPMRQQQMLGRHSIELASFETGLCLQAPRVPTTIPLAVQIQCTAKPTPTKTIKKPHNIFWAPYLLKETMVEEMKNLCKLAP